MRTQHRFHTYPEGEGSEVVQQFFPGGEFENAAVPWHGPTAGNVTAVIDSQARIVQQTGYYPYGEPWTEPDGDNSYFFGGKERVAMGGLGWSDFGPRLFSSPTGYWCSPDSKSESFYDVSPYIYCLANPVMFRDPSGKQSIYVHGTFARPETWKRQAELTEAFNKNFGSGETSFAIEWTGGNNKKARHEGALKLIAKVKEYAADDSKSTITLAGHSHGGNVIIEAVNMMVEMPELDGIKFNIVTINTPVRDDYQLSEKAQERVGHFNVYDPNDPVQIAGGDNVSSSLKSMSIAFKSLNSEAGRAGRKFKNAKNIEVDNSQPWFYIRPFSTPASGSNAHNSHNLIEDWIYKL